MPSSPQRRNNDVPVLYQIDFTAVAAGKRVASSKRRIRWRFGFANPEALRNGQTGTACRGEEHDVTLVWSLTSGKRLVLADGQEVHFSNSRSNLFEYTWTMRGNHVLKIVAHAAPPLSPTPGFRQYDFLVNGQSFFSFPKVFRIGLAPNDPRGQTSPVGGSMMAESTRFQRPSGPGGVGGPRRSNSSNIANLEAPGNQDEEELYLQEAIRQSLKDDVKPKAAPAPAPPSDLLDFGDTPVSAPTPAVPAVTSFSGVESVQSDPFFGGQSKAPIDHQSFTSLPAITAGYGPGAQSTNFAAPAPGALVVAAPSSGYGGYDNPYSGAIQPSSNPYGNAYAPVTTSTSTPAPAPYQYSAPNQYAATTGNPYEATNTNPYGAPVTAPNPYVAPVPAASNPYAAPAPQVTNSNPYGAPAISNNPYAAPVPPVPSNPYSNAEPTDAKSAWTPPAPITTQPNPYDSTLPSQPYETFHGGIIPPAVTPHMQQTPSSLGFASPTPDFSGFSPNPDEKTNGNVVSTPFGPTSLTMNGLANFDEPVHEQQEPTQQPQQQPTSAIQSTFAKLANFDNFSVSSNMDAKRSNPFESPANSTIGGNKSLGEMAKNKPKPTKEIMKTHQPAQPQPVTTNMYGQSQFGMQPPTMAQPSYGQAPQQNLSQLNYGQPPPQQQMQGMSQPNYGQAPPQQPMQQVMPQPTYGQQPPPSQQYNQYQQQPTFAQQPPPTIPPQQYGFGQQLPPVQTQTPPNPYGQPQVYPTNPSYY